MKKALLALFAVLCVLAAGCAPIGTPVEETSTTATTTTTETTTAVTTTPFISEERAVEIAETYWGVHSGDRAPKTEFVMSVSAMELPTDEKPEYRMVFRWLVMVNGEPSHYSTLDSIRLDAVTGEILSPTPSESES